MALCVCVCPPCNQLLGRLVLLFPSPYRCQTASGRVTLPGGAMRPACVCVWWGDGAGEQVGHLYPPLQSCSIQLLFCALGPLPKISAFLQLRAGGSRETSGEVQRNLRPRDPVCQRELCSEVSHLSQFKRGRFRVKSTEPDLLHKTTKLS